MLLAWIRDVERWREPPSSDQVNSRMSGSKFNRFDRGRTVDAISSGRNSQHRSVSIYEEEVLELNSKPAVRCERNEKKELALNRQ